jgi:hypothetical protein
MAARRKLDRRRDDLCAGELRKRVANSSSPRPQRLGKSRKKPLTVVSRRIVDRNLYVFGTVRPETPTLETLNSATVEHRKSRALCDRYRRDVSGLWIDVANEQTLALRSLPPLME